MNQDNSDATRRVSWRHAAAASVVAILLIGFAIWMMALVYNLLYTNNSAPASAVEIEPGQVESFSTPFVGSFSASFVVPRNDGSITLNAAGTIVGSYTFTDGAIGNYHAIAGSPYGLMILVPERGVRVPFTVQIRLGKLERVGAGFLLPNDIGPHVFCNLDAQQAKKMEAEGMPAPFEQAMIKALATAKARGSMVQIDADLYFSDD